MKWIYLILISFLLVSCSNEEEKKTFIEDKKNVEVVENANIKSEIKYDINNKKNVILDNGDSFSLYSDETYIYIVFSDNNNYKYSFNYYYSNENFYLKLQNHKIVSSTINPFESFNFVNNVIFKKYNVKFLNLEIDLLNNELNIDNYNDNFQYNNLSKINIFKNKKANILNIDLSNKKYCNKLNNIVFSKNNINENLISYNNLKNNQLACSESHLILFNGGFEFEDKRDLSLFDKNVLIGFKDSIFKKIKNSKFPLNIQENKDNFHIIVNASEQNYSLDYKYDNKKQIFNLIVNQVPEEWTSIDRIILSKDIFLKLNSFNIKQNKFYNLTKTYTPLSSKIEEDFELHSFNTKGIYFSYINNLKCNYFNDQLIIEIKSAKTKPELQFIKGKKSNCKTYSTNKIAANFDDFNIKTINFNKSLYNNKYLDFKYSNNYFYFNNNEYKLYNYRIVNNQLNLYIDKPNEKYIISNPIINKVKLEQYSNINIINLYDKEKPQYLLKKHLKVYRDYEENLKINTKVYDIEHQSKYFVVRLNTISLDNDLLLCDDSDNFMQLKKEGKSSYTYYFNDFKDCGNYGVGVYIFKLIGNNFDLDFYDNRKKENLNNLRKKHDEFKYIFSRSIKENSLDFDFEVIYVNNVRYITFKINDFNIKSNFNIDYNFNIKNKKVKINLFETKNFNNKNNFYDFITTNKGINGIDIIFKDIEGKENIHSISFN